jgi:hypothetical protein
MTLALQTARLAYQILFIYIFFYISVFFFTQLLANSLWSVAWYSSQPDVWLEESALLQRYKVIFRYQAIVTVIF